MVLKGIFCRWSQEYFRLRIIWPMKRGRTTVMKSWLKIFRVGTCTSDESSCKKQKGKDYTTK